MSTQPRDARGRFVATDRQAQWIDLPSRHLHLPGCGLCVLPKPEAARPKPAPRRTPYQRSQAHLDHVARMDAIKAEGAAAMQAVIDAPPPSPDYTLTPGEEKFTSIAAYGLVAVIGGVVILFAGAFTLAYPLIALLLVDPAGAVWVRRARRDLNARRHERTLANIARLERELLGM